MDTQVEYIPGTTPCLRTQQRWNRRLLMEGHYRPYERRGNKRPGTIVGSDKFLLVLFRSKFPKATAAEVAAFLYNNTLNHNPRIFTPSQISYAEDSLGLTRKKGSTLAIQALRPENVLRRNMFWGMAFPYGVVGIPTQSLVDVDECGIMLEGCNRHHGKSYFGTRVVEKGWYGRGVKWTITLAIAATGERWCWVEEKAGTTAADFVNFIEHVVGHIDPQEYNGARTILMDNLHAHTTPLVQQTITDAGHQLLYRPKYRPADAPIEYVFNTLQAELRVRMREVDGTNIVDHIRDIIANMNGFQNYFTFCGY